MKKNDMKVIFIIFLFFSLISPLFAATIILKSGVKIESEIIEKTDEYIKINLQGVLLKYYFDEIERIDGESSYASQPPASQSAFTKTPQDIFRDVSSAIVYITTETVTGQQQLGSGFIVESGGIVATNYHVVRSAKEVSIKIKSGQGYAVTDIIYADATKNI